MKAKIDWYKEVLELEPGSKVFFPLARLLAENGLLQDALSTLHFGLERHPEFFEARLYLIDLLYKNGLMGQCESQVGQLTNVFSQYPGFWDAWGTCTDIETRRDIALTLRLLAMLFQHPHLSLGDVLEKGLEAIGATGPTALPSEPAVVPYETARPLEGEPKPQAKSVERHVPVGTAGVAALHAPSPVTAGAGEMDEAEEPFTLRTKAMADVLAGQGDLNGALEIYRELALNAVSHEERREIYERIAQLSSQQAQAGEAPASVTPDALVAPGRQRMQHLLESLAERLEARALG